MINVLYATKVNIGGWATFTRHLVDSLRAEGHEVRLLKIGNRNEGFTRPFGPEHSYMNQTPEALNALAMHEPMIIAALGKHYVEQAEELMRLGARIVVHDTAESTNRMKLDRPWCIRKCLAAMFDDGVFIRHPYVRRATGTIATRSKKIFATSRVDFDKNTTMILDANRLGAKIEIVGFENRLYTKFKVVPDYPEWVQSPGTHPRTGADSFRLLTSALAMVDLTDIKGDGGGTQYTFLEAWDAGAIPIIGEWWLRKDDDMVHGKTCLAIRDARTLAKQVKILRREPQPYIASQGQKALKRHEPKIIVPQVMEWINAR